MQKRETKRRTKSLAFVLLGAAAALLVAVVAVQCFPKSSSANSAANASAPFPVSSKPVAAEDMLPVSEDKGATAAHAGTPGEDFVEAEAMVVMNEETTAEDAAEFDALVEQYGATAHIVSDTGFGSGGAIKRLVAPSEDAISQLIDALAGSDAIVHVQRSYLYHTMDDGASAPASAATTSDASAPAATSSQLASPASAAPAAPAAPAAASLQAATPVQTLSAPDLSTIKATSVNDPRTVAGEQDLFLNDYYAPAATPFSGANVAKAWTLSRCAEDAVGGSSVTVAVLDTGCDVTHEDLRDNIDTAHMGMVEAVEVIENGTKHTDYEVKTGECKDIYGHGTHVAGIVGASTNNNRGVAGASYNATVLPINIFYYASRTVDQPSSNTTRMVYAFRYLEKLITSGELTDLRVVNMSLGAYGNQDNDFLLHQIMAKFRDTYRVITVCAGGNGTNQGPITEPNYPGDFPEAFSVTWLNPQGGVHWRADYNEDKDISAPGTDIMSTMDKAQTLYNANHQSYGKMSGSSMATPVVSGIAALMWTRYPDLTVDQVREAMQKTAHKVANQPATSGSAGAVDALAALVYAGTNFAGDTFEDLQPTQPAQPTQPKQSLATAEIVVSDQTFTGFALEPELTVTLNGQALMKGDDYTVEYTNNLNKGTARVTITGKGNYSETATTTFEITAPTQARPATWGVQGSESACKWYLAASPVTYAGKPTYTLVLVGGDARGVVPQKDKDSNTLAPWDSWTSEISRVEVQDTVILPEDSSNLFRGCALVDSMDLSKFDSSHATTMASMFMSCMSLASLNVSSFDTRNVTNMNMMFSACGSLKSLNLSNFNTERVTNMIMMFYSCSKLAEVNVSSFDTRNATLAMMFGGCSSLSELNLASFATSNAFWLLNGTTSLARLTLGTGFTADLASTKLGAPYVPAGQEGTGLWKNQATGKTYAPADIPAGVAATYVADVVVPKKSISSATVEGLYAVTYSGSEQKLVPTVTLDGTKLSSPADYTVSYSGDTVNAGTVTLIIEGAGGYEGTIIRSYRIEPRSLTGATVALEHESYPATGAAIEPRVVSVRVGGLSVSSDNYDVSYRDNTEPGTGATVTLRGKKNFTDSVRTTFTIQGVLSKNTARATIEDVTYGENLDAFIKPVVVLTGGTQLTKGVDYNVSYAGLPTQDPGAGKSVQVTATFRGVNRYDAPVAATDLLTCTFNVGGKAASPEQPSDVHTYTGKPIRPGVNLTDANGTALKEGVDYLIAYSNNVRPGTARMTIVGIGLYCGTIERTFKIVRPARNATPSSAQSVAPESTIESTTSATARSTIDTVAVATAAQMTFCPDTLYKLG